MTVGYAAWLLSARLLRTNDYANINAAIVVSNSFFMRQVLDGHRFDINKFIRHALTWSTSSSSYFFDSRQAMSSGDVFQLLLHSFFTARTKFFFQGFFEPSTTRFYICQFNGMGSADTDIKVIDLRDLLYDLMTPFFTWLTKSMTARFCGYISTTSAKSTTSN